MTSLEAMQKVAAGEMTAEDAAKLLQSKKLKLKVSQKGAVQLDGLRRFPVTLYAGEWRQIFGMKDEIEKFMKDNAKSLTEKNGDE